jgi:hypothetical protein
MKHEWYGGPLWANPVVDRILSVDLGKLPAGDYTAKWVIHTSVFGPGFPEPKETPEDDETPVEIGPTSALIMPSPLAASRSFTVAAARDGFEIKTPIKRGGPALTIAVTPKDAFSNYWYDLRVSVEGRSDQHFEVRNGIPITKAGIRLASLDADPYLDIMIPGGTDDWGPGVVQDFDLQRGTAGVSLDRRPRRRLTRRNATTSRRPGGEVAAHRGSLPMHQRCLCVRMKRSPPETAIVALVRSPRSFRARCSYFGPAAKTDVTPFLSVM